MNQTVSQDTSPTLTAGEIIIIVLQGGDLLLHIFQSIKEINFTCAFKDWFFFSEDIEMQKPTDS